MIEEAFISYETAELLNGKKYDFVCDYQYNVYSRKYAMYNVTDRARYSEDYIDAPTQAMVMRWLREVYNIYFLIKYYSLDIGHNWMYLSIWKMGEKACEVTFEGYSYEEECENAIQYCLKYMI